MTASMGLTWNAAAAGTYPIAGYNIYRGGVKVATSQATSYTDTGLANSTAYTYTVTALDNQGNESAQSASATATTLPVSGTLPSGVTLQAIDGETMTSSTTMSHNYYGRNGFTIPTTTSWHAGVKSWDDPTFFPIMCDYCFNTNNFANLANFNALFLNSSIRIDGGATNNTANCVSNGIWYFQDPYGSEGPPIGNANPGSGPTNAAGAALHIEEPGSVSSYQGAVNGFQSLGYLSGRPVQVSITSSNMQSGGGMGGQPLSSVFTTNVGSTGRHTDILSIDVYWFSGANGVSSDWGNMNTMYGGGISSNDQALRGSNYGDLTDMMRYIMGGTQTQIIPAPGLAPVFPYVENSNSLLTSATEITPPQMNWAVWSSLIHGARLVVYFTTSGSYASQFGFNPNILGGQSISLYNQAIATNGLVTNLAQILNSPFAMSFATVSPAGYNFPTGNTTSWGDTIKHWYYNLANGIEIMAKWYQGGAYTPSSGPLSGKTMNNGFYIFADVRGSQSQTNVSATFTVSDTGVTSVPVVNENRNVTLSAASGGKRTFTDTFALASTVHIYGPF